MFLSFIILLDYKVIEETEDEHSYEWKSVVRCWTTRPHIS